MTVARSMRCGSCGGQAPIVALSPAFPCPFCRATLHLPPELLRELGAYGDAVATAHVEARDQAALAAQYQMYAGPSATPMRTFGLALLLCMVLPIGLGMLGSVLVNKHVLPSAFGPVISALTMLSTLGGIGYYIWYLSAARRKQAGPTAQARSVACPQCGAPNALEAGAPVGACRFCRAPLVPTQTVIREAVADARAVARRARVERRRGERAMMKHVQSFSAANAIPYIAIGSFVGMLGLASCGATLSGLTSSRPFDPAVLLMWPFFALGVGVLFAIWYFRKERAERWARATLAVAQAHSGSRLETLAEAVHWLDTQWDGEFAAEQLMVGPAFSAVAAWVTGLPALCWVDPVGASEAQQARIVVLLAAWIPGLSDGSGRAPPRTPGVLGMEQALLRTGFAVEIGEAGLVARADPATLEQWKKQPERALALAPVLSMLGSLASAVAARPVARAPA